MSGMRVLALDTSTEACSAALLWPGGETRLRFELTERSHANLILPMIDSLLAEAGCRLGDLDGLAFGRGPGGFTGLRIAAGVVQGLAYGANLRVAPVSSLAAVAYLASLDRGGEGALVCNDARMNEVYWGCFRFATAEPCEPLELAPEAVGPPDRVTFPAGVGVFAGNGLPRYPGLQARLEAAGLQYCAGLFPRADAVARLGAWMLQQGLAVTAAEAHPTYIRDNVAWPAGPAVTGMS